MAYNGVEVFNAIRNATPSLQSRYPEASETTLKEIGYNLSRDSVDMKAAYLNGLLEMVSAVFVSNTRIENPLADLIRGGQYYEWGNLIEKIKVRIAKAVDPKFLVDNLGTGKTIDPFVQNQPETVTEFFKINLPMQYIVTISDWQLQRAFESAQGMNALISEILESVQNGMKLDLYEAGKSIFNAYINDTTYSDGTARTLGDGQVATVADVTSEATGKTFVNAVKNIVSSMAFPTKAYNPMGILNTQSSGSLTMFCKPELLNKLSVDVWASAFNRDDLDLTPVGGNGKMRIKSLDNFGGIYATDAQGHKLNKKYNSLGAVIGYEYNGVEVSEKDITWVDPNKDVLAVITDVADFGGIALRKERFSNIYNPRGEYVNYWFNAEYWVYYSNMANVVIIKKASK